MRVVALVGIYLLFSSVGKDADDDNTIFHSALICVTEEKKNMCI